MTSGDHCRRLPRCQCQSVCLARAVHLLVVAAPPRGLTTASQGRTAPPTEPRLALPSSASAFASGSRVASFRLASLRLVEPRRAPSRRDSLRLATHRFCLYHAGSHACITDHLLFFSSSRCNPLPLVPCHSLRASVLRRLSRCPREAASSPRRIFRHLARCFFTGSFAAQRGGWFLRIFHWRTDVPGLFARG